MVACTEIQLFKRVVRQIPCHRHGALAGGPNWPWRGISIFEFAGASREAVLELHGRLWGRLSGREAAAAPAEPRAEGDSREAAVEQNLPACLRMSKFAQAIGCLIEDPGRTDAEIARLVGCARTSLYRMPDYVRVRERLEKLKHERRRGFVSLATAPS